MILNSGIVLRAELTDGNTSIATLSLPDSNSKPVTELPHEVVTVQH